MKDAIDRVMKLKTEIAPEVYGDKGGSLAVQLAGRRSTITVAEGIAVAVAARALYGDKGAVDVVMKLGRYSPPEGDLPAQQRYPRKIRLKLINDDLTEEEIFFDKADTCVRGPHASPEGGREGEI